MNKNSVKSPQNRLVQIIFSQLLQKMLKSCQMRCNSKWQMLKQMSDVDVKNADNKSANLKKVELMVSQMVQTSLFVLLLDSACRTDFWLFGSSIRQS